MKKKSYGKKLLAWVLALAVSMTLVPVMGQREVQAAKIMNAWDGETTEVPKTDENGTYQISNGAELAWFAKKVNDGASSINGELTDKIYLGDGTSQNKWLMIGDTAEHAYKGTFNGNGYTVYFLDAEISEENPDVRYAGLFGVIDGGTISNVKVSGEVHNNYAAYKTEGKYEKLYIGSGGIAGYLKSGTISGCTNYTETTMAGEALRRNAGGIVGICSGTVRRCVNNGTLSTKVRFAQHNIGGIAGMEVGPNAVIRYCENKEAVQGYYSVGGIAGGVYQGAAVQNCYNKAKISGVDTIGGIAGGVNESSVYADGTVKECLIQNVYNQGELGGLVSYTGTIVGGIVGKLGYADTKEEENPAQPVIKNAYNIAVYTNKTFEYRGAIIGIFKSGKIGRVYALRADSSYNLDLYSFKEDKTTEIIDETGLYIEKTMKSQKMITKLGSAFIKASIFDAGGGYPKLAFEEQTTDLKSKIDSAIEELQGWQSEENKKKYGTTYILIEQTVENYLEKIDSVVTQDDLDSVMKEAREALQKIKPGSEVDSKLLEARNNAILELAQYQEELLQGSEKWSEEQIAELKQTEEQFEDEIENALTIADVEALLKTAKDRLNELSIEYTESAKLGEIKASAIEELKNYASDVTVDETWKNKIETAKADGEKQIQSAKTSKEVASALVEAKKQIDEILNTIPQEGAWDGKSTKEPKFAEGYYQISNGAELAWFAQLVNSGVTGAKANAQLCDDINHGNHNWTPIGSSSKIPYTGSFDGQDHVVRGLRIESGDTYAGLFGIVYGDEKQSIENLTVKGSIECGEKIAYAGGIVAYMHGKNESQRNYIRNCHSEVQIQVKNAKRHRSAVGGIVGYADKMWVNQCSNKGNVSLESAGGIQFYAGGIIGDMANSVSVRQSVNRGSVEAEFCAGGLVGRMSGSNGAVTSNYNTGDVLANSYAGGLIGVMTGASGGSQISCCYNIGDVNLNISGKCIGALFGAMLDGTYTNLTALKNPANASLPLVGLLNGSASTGEYLEADKMKTESFLNALLASGNHFIKDYMNTQDGFPILKWELNLEEFRAGAVKDLQTFVKAEEYTEENWVQVSALIAEGVEKLQSAKNMDEMNEILTDSKQKIYEIETLKEAEQKQLESAIASAIEELQNYADETAYREAEKIQLETYVSDGLKYLHQADSVEKVNQILADVKSRIDRLETDEQKTQKENQEKISAVEAYINQIGTVNLESKTYINVARSAYDELSEELKAKVSNYDVLESAEKEYARLLEESEVDEADKKAASAVDELINKLEPVTIDKKDAILQARKAYDTLTKKQQSLVAHPEYLNRAEQTYDKLKAQEVSAEISAILTGTITLNSKDAIYKAQQLYDALTDNQKKLVTNYKQLQNAKAMYQNLILASPVIELIKNIGEVTLEKGGAITRAIEAYNALTAEQQELVSNYSVLEEAYQNYSDLLAAHQVSTKISQIGVVTKESGSLLEQIRNAYNNLSDRQKSMVGNYSDLEKAESAYQGLNKSDETSQIKNTAATGETANSHAGAHESGYAKQNGSSNATGSGNAAEKSGNAKNGEQAQEKKTEETAKENQEAKTEQTGNADGEESSAENETALLSGEEGDAGVSMQNGEENTAKSSVPTAQNYRVVKILCAVLGVLVILVLAGIGFMVIGSKKRKKILLKY